MITESCDLGEIDSPLLLFGGSYSNLAATEAVLNQAARLHIDARHIICTGDIVAYCAEAEGTSQLIQSADIHSIMGNCEESLALGSKDCGCGFEPGMACSALSEKWYQYARNQVSEYSREWMASLPRAISFSMQGKNFRVVHGGVDQINRFIFSSTRPSVKLQEIDQSGADIIIGGHCGIPFGEKMGKKGWLNTGVIGLPANDGTVSTWFMLITPADKGLKVSWHRLDYDFERTHHSMLDQGLDDYADTIKNGLWPSMDILPDQEKSSQGKPLHLEDIYF